MKCRLSIARSLLNNPDLMFLDEPTGRLLPGNKRRVQALLSAAMPSSILFTAVGRLRLLGVARIGGVVLGILMFLVLLPTLHEAAFGIGLSISALPYFLLGLYGEIAPLPRCPPRGSEVFVRYGAALIAAASFVFYLQHVWLASGLVIVIGVAVLPKPALALWRMFS